MTTEAVALCWSCSRLREDQQTCVAFPRGIPDEIRLFGKDHRRPISGDHGFHYDPDPDKQDERDEWLYLYDPAKLGDKIGP